MINIQAILTPHMEVLHKELAFAETLMKIDSHLSTHEGLVDLDAELDVQIQSLEVACNNWDATLKIILEVHQIFLDKHTICVLPMT